MAEVEGPFEAKLAVRRVNRWLLGLAMLPALGGLALLAVADHGVSFALAAISAFLVSVVLRRNPAPVTEEETVRVEPEALRFGSQSLARARIRDAQIVPTLDGKVFVRVASKGRPLPTDLVVRDRDEGRRLLRALGFDASQTVMKFRGSSRVIAHAIFRSGWWMFGLVGAFAAIAMLLESSPMLWALATKALFLLVAVAVIAMVIPSRIDVGADGVLITWAGLKRFLPLAQMTSVEQAIEGFGRNRQVGAKVTMEGGHIEWLAVGSSQWNGDRAAALVERIREAMETHARGHIDAAAALLGRRARDVRDWIQELRAIGAGANADLRTAAVSPEHLWRIVESHGAEAEERAAAAVALGASLDEGGKRRMRVAVGTVADEKLRVAIDAAAREDDAALEEALGEVSEGKAP